MRVVLVLLALGAVRSFAGEQEIGLSLGALLVPDRSVSGGTLRFSAGTALQANYARRFAHLRYVDLLGEVHFLASPQQQIRSLVTAATKDIAVLYLTPGIRVKFLPENRLSPWVVAGGGYALYEQSTATLGGNVNGAPRHTSGAALAFGGGADFKVLPGAGREWLRGWYLRGDLREFYTGSPKFNVPVTGTGQFNLVMSGGIVWRFGR